MSTEELRGFLHSPKLTVRTCQEAKTPQKETHLPNPAVQVRAVSFREGSLLISTFPHTNYRGRFLGVASKPVVFFSNSKTTENIRVSGGQGNALEGFWYEQEQRY